MATFGTFTAGQVLTAAELNAAGALTDYTPSWTQSATISKTVNWARYSQLNKLVFVSIKMTATSAGTAANTILVGLPVNASSNNYLMGTGFFDAASNEPLFPVYNNSTTVAFVTSRASTAGFLGSGTSLLAVTVASGDVMYMNLVYEAA